MREELKSTQNSYVDAQVARDQEKETLIKEEYTFAGLVLSNTISFVYFRSCSFIFLSRESDQIAIKSSPWSCCPTL